MVVPKKKFRIWTPSVPQMLQDIITETGNGTWTEFPPDPRLSAPECVETLWSRDNHLGNSLGGYPISYNWTIPDIPHDHCVLRIRLVVSIPAPSSCKNYCIWQMQYRIAGNFGVRKLSRIGWKEMRISRRELPWIAWCRQLWAPRPQNIVESLMAPQTTKFGN